MNPCPTQPSPITPSRRFPATAGLRLNCSDPATGLASDAAQSKLPPDHGELVVAGVGNRPDI